MLDRALALGVVLGFLACPNAALAYVNEPILVPSSPVAGQVVGVRLESGICDTFVDGPNTTDISRVGNTITLLVDGVHLAPSTWCNLAETSLVFPAGAFEAGAYTLRVDRRYTSLIYPAGVIQTLATIPFDVAPGAMQTPVPALGPRGLFVLAVSVIFLVRRKIV